MLKPMSNQDEDPPSSTKPLANDGNVVHLQNTNTTQEPRGVISFLKKIIKNKSDSSLRETIEDYIDEALGETQDPSVTAQEKTIIANVLDLHDITAADVMIPRADIVALEKETTQEELFALLATHQYSRLPVYDDNLDNIIGAIHIKDILATVAKGERVKIEELARDIPIVSPAINLLDLLLQMRLTRKHMVLVIDEFGGIDGLVTIGDIIEDIVGKIDDEHDPDSTPNITENPDGTIIADARFDIDEFEERFGKILNEDERENHDTLGGLVFALAGHVPVRGELLKHSSGMIFEILDADLRRVNILKIRNIPVSTPTNQLTD